MLSKLFRYELKAVGRIMVPLHLAALGGAVVLGLMMRLERGSRQYFAEDLSFLLITLLILYSILFTAVIVMTGVLSVTRFHNNLLGTEGYLMFSLPAGTPALIISKVLSSIFWAFLSVVTGCLSGLLFIISYDLRDLIDFDWSLLDIRDLMEALRHADIGILILVLLSCVLGLAAVLIRIYAAMAVGHLWSSHRTLGAILAYLAFGVIEGWVGFFLTSRGLPSFGSFFLFEAIDNGAMSGATPWLTSIAGSLISIAIYGVITDLILDRRLNLE